jgi:hypothetical protein
MMEDERIKMEDEREEKRIKRRERTKFIKRVQGPEDGKNRARGAGNQNEFSRSNELLIFWAALVSKLGKVLDTG